MRESHPGRWTCPGRHCGTYQGYKYGCRAEQCTAAVAPHQEAQRRARGSKPMTAIDDATLRQVLTAISAGASLATACTAAGISAFRLGTFRRNNPGFDAQLVAAAAQAGLQPPVRPVRQIRCPGDCGTVGYRYGCRNELCTSAHSAAIADSPSRQFAGRQRKFGPEDADAILRELRSGRTIMEAAEAAGWSYDALSNARKTDPAFDEAVLQARAAGRLPGAPGDIPRRVSRRSLSADPRMPRSSPEG